MKKQEEVENSLWTKIKHWMADTGKQLAVAIFIVMLLRSSIIEPYKIPSGSMIPTLFIGDHIFVNKFSYGFKVPFTEFFLDKPIYVTKQQVPNRGDVIVFRYPRDESINYIKRVIGLPGDTIAIRDKILYINNKPINETALTDPKLSDGIENDNDKSVLMLYAEDLMGIKHAVLHDGKSLLGSDFGPITIPSDSLFVMGDNRDRSSDSRIWGYVPLDNVKGKAIIIWLNFMLSLEDEFKFKFRFDRIATAIR